MLLSFNYLWNKHDMTKEMVFSRGKTEKRRTSTENKGARRRNWMWVFSIILRTIDREIEMTLDFYHSQNKHDKATKVSFLEERLKCVRLQRKIKEQEDKIKRKLPQILKIYIANQCKPIQRIYIQIEGVIFVVKHSTILLDLFIPQTVSTFGSTND